MTTFTLIRHAQPQAWLDNVVAGPTGDTGLSDLGRRQALALRDRLLDTAFTTDVVLTSVLPRAIETTEILAPALGGLAPTQDCDYCELHPGEADGLPWDEYQFALQTGGPTRDARRAVLAGWRVAERVRAPCAPRPRRPPDRSCRPSRDGRVARRIHQRGVPRAARRAHRRRARGFLLAPKLTSITEWVSSDERDGVWRLERYNDAAHLEGTMMS